jgi:acetyl esterase/lipase
VAALRKALAQDLAFTELLTQAFTTAPLTKEAAQQARTLLWEHHAARIRRERAAEVQARLVREGIMEMPFHYRLFGQEPPQGRSLWFSLHGGGGTTPQINDSQWENQKRLYRLEEGIYFVPRAPTNTAAMWHHGHIDRMLARIIEDLIVLERVDPDRVFVMGYSAGGDGVYQLAPRMADYFAAAAMMAGHPNDASPLGLRNLPFALQVGGKDTAYNRNGIARLWEKELARLRKEDPTGYPQFVKIYEDKGHWMNREDAVAVPWMAQFRRNPVPDRVVWRQAPVTHDRFYWLAVPPEQARPGALVIVERQGQTITLEKAEGVSRLLLRLDDRLVDLEKPIQVKYQGRILWAGQPSRTIATLIRSLEGRGDPKLMFEAEVVVDLPTSAAK